MWEYSFSAFFFFAKNKQKPNHYFLDLKKQNRITQLTESESTVLTSWIAAIIAWSVIMTDFSVHFSLWNTKLQWVEKWIVYIPRITFLEGVRMTLLNHFRVVLFFSLLVVGVVLFLLLCILIQMWKWCGCSGGKEAY